MAAPTATTDTQPNYVIDVTGTNVDAGNNDYKLEYNQVNLSKGFSIITGTLTAMTVTLLAYNKDSVLVDSTSDLCGVTSLASDTAYFIDIPAPVKGIVVRAVRSNATNEINLTIFAPKKIMPRKLDDILAELDAPPPIAQAPADVPSFDVNESIDRNAQLHGIPVEIAHAMIQQESAKNPTAQSNKGAYGFAQLMPATAKELGVDINDPEQNVEGGMRYLGQMYGKYGDWSKALAAYNAGPGAVDKYNGIPPFKETQNYVNKILKAAGTKPDKEAAAPRKLDDILAEIDSLAPADAPLIPGEDLAGPPVAPPEALPPEAITASPESPDLNAGLMAVLTGGLSIPYTTMMDPKGALESAQSFAQGLGEGTGYNAYVKPAIESIADPIASALLGQDVAPIRAAQEQSTAQAVENNPMANLGGEVTSILAGPVGKISAPLKAEGIMAKAGKMLLEGGAQGGSFEALSNEDATPQSIAESTLLGAGGNVVAGGTLAGIAKASKGFGNALLNFVVKTGKPEVANYITTNFGPTISSGSLKIKNQALIDNTAKELKAHLKNLDETSGRRLNIKNLVQSPQITSFLDSLENSGNNKLAAKIRGQLDEIANRGQEIPLGPYDSATHVSYRWGKPKTTSPKLDTSELLAGKSPNSTTETPLLAVIGIPKPTLKDGLISLEQANGLKMDLYKQSNFNSRSKKPNRALILKKLALVLKDSIETVSGDATVKTLNGTIANGIETRQALDAMGAPAKLRTYLELGTAFTNPSTIPFLAAGRAATSVPGATTTATATNALSKGIDLMSPDIQTLINTLMPQQAKKFK